jgi:REJ domain
MIILLIIFKSSLGFLNCPENCLSCSDAGCLVCEPGYYTVEDKAYNGCFKGPRELGPGCSSGCASCNAAGCTNCSSGYYLDKSSNCQNCSSNCLSCNSTGCLICSSNYTLNSTSESCYLTCSSNCLSCNSSGCVACNTSYTLNSTSKTCSLACPSNCLSCSSAGCTTCGTNYTLNSTSLTCNLECSDNCLSCNSSGCITCNSGYSLNSSSRTCNLNCPSNCLSCNVSGCSACITNYTLNSTTNTCSLTCPENCLSCDSSGCLSCSSGYNLNPATNVCTKVCDSGYYVLGSTCQLCPSNCSTCTGSGCTSCSTGYFLDSKSQSCLSNCNQNCLSCSNSLCTSCAPGYYLYLNTYCMACYTPLCAVCTNNMCSACQSGYGLSSSSPPICAPCPTGCISCNGPCTKCNTTYYLSLNDKSCANCPSNCDECSNSTACSSCSAGYNLNFNSTCQNCSSTCGSCGSVDCASCLAGYYMGSDYSCAPCGTNCNACSSSQCTGCYPGYYLTSDSSKCCAQNCIDCNATQCTNCSSGYYLNSNLACQSCSKNCEICDQNGCTKCISNYSINYQNLTCRSGCTANCLSCDGLGCIYCSPGYYLGSDLLCHQCRAGCIACNNLTCSVCNATFYLDNYACYQCLDNCSLCYNSSVCLSCVHNFYLLNNSCIACEAWSVVDAHFDSNFASITVKFSTEFTSDPITECSGLLVSKYNIGEGAICKSSANTFELIFGNDYSFSNTSEFGINITRLYNHPCSPPSNGVYMLKAYFSSPAVFPYASIKGVLYQSTGCESQYLVYKADSISGNLQCNLLYNWTATAVPTNQNLTNLFLNQINNSVIVPLSFFTDTSVLKITLYLQNSIKMKSSSTFTTQIYNNKTLAITIDAGDYISIESSKIISLNAQISDTCGCSYKPKFFWNFTGTNNTSFNSTGLVKSSSQFSIPKNYLKPNFTYNFSVVANCSNITGQSFITISSEFSPLVVVLNQKSGTISNIKDLVVNGGESYDPNGISQISYSWGCSYINNTSCNSLIQNISSNYLTIKSSSLVSGYLNITLTISALNNTRTSSASILLQVIQNLKTFISTSFNQTKIEPSMDYLIASQIVSYTNYTIQWTQLAGNSIPINPNNLPSLYIPTGVLTRGVSYTFQVSAKEKEGYTAYYNISFTTNLLPMCLGSMSITPSSGLPLNTLFEFNIDSCTDPDGDLPIVYTFGVISSAGRVYAISLSKEFSSISNKMFSGNLTGYAKVCDQYLGCVYYYQSILVTQNRRELDSLDPLQSYITDTLDQELVPIYSSAYLQTYILNLTSMNYIYKDVYDYITSKATIDEDCMNIAISTVLDIVDCQAHLLSYDLVSLYYTNIINIMQNSTYQVSSYQITSSFEIIDKVASIKSLNPDYLVLNNWFINNIVELYSLNDLPGTVILNVSSTLSTYYKYRGLCSSLYETMYNISNTVYGYINEVFFSGSEIINIVFMQYTQTDDYSDIVFLSLTSSGKSSTGTLGLSTENPLSLAASSIELSLYIKKNTTSSWACLRYNSGSWEPNCKVVKVEDNYVTIQASTSSMYKIIDSSLVTFTTDNYGPVCITGILFLILIIVLIYLLFYFEDDEQFWKRSKNVEIKKQEDQNTINLDVEDESFYYFVWTSLKLYSVFGMFAKDTKRSKINRILSTVCVLNTQLAIQGVFIGYYTVSTNYDFNLAAVGIISAACAFQFHFSLLICLYLSNQILIRILRVFWGISIATAMSVIIFISIKPAFGRHTDWVISFFWGVLSELMFEAIFSTSFYYFKIFLRKKRLSVDRIPKIETNTSRNEIVLSSPKSLKGQDKISHNELTSTSKNYQIEKPIDSNRI